ncbi:unnamed protein product [Porites evermanni]|uniref:Uncharacterized protein n=1 Tax=Porites evermanni TaxID=104178 RepID=A0ABN8SKK3_9CNID|nr:unnamed protein product [Porites evermanni]
MAGKCLFRITSEWFLDYCIYQLWKEFRDKCSFSDCWKDRIQDYLENKPFVIGQELSTKLHCIRFIIGLHEHQPIDSQFSQSSTYSSSTEDENESRLLGQGCLNYFDKITGIYPFSDVEKSHMRSALKLQIILSHFTHGDMKGGEQLYSVLYSDDGDDEEYQDEIRELFQSENDSWKKLFLRKHTYDRFLNQVKQFFMPVWKKFEAPVLEEASFLENTNGERSRVDAITIKNLYFAWDESEEAEKNWTDTLEGTHPDIIALKSKRSSRHTQDTTTSNSNKDKSPSVRQLRQETRSRAEPSGRKKSNVAVNIERCDEAMQRLKSSSRNLFSGLKDVYSNMVAGEAGPSKVNSENNNDNDTNDIPVKRHCKAVVAEPDSASGQEPDKKGKRPIESRSAKRRFNEHQSDAEILDWDSDSDDDFDETEIKRKTIKLSSPRKRVLNVKLPVRERRRFWTDKETKWLKDGVKTYGEGNWAVILDAYNFVGRTSVHLKDKWRNLQKN